VRERRKVAAGSERAVLGHDGGEAGVEQRDDRLGHHATRAGGAIVSVRARSRSIVRTTSRSTGGPISASCERMSARCSSSRRVGIATFASEPKPVETP
jgi:hypothetical protein